jgi:hypothetical protein
LGTSLCFQARSARTGILRCRTTRVVKGRCKSISLARPWCVHCELCSTFLTTQLKINLRSTERAQTSSPRTCTWLRTACVVTARFFRSFSLTLRHFLYIDLVLGTSVEARRVVGTSLCQVGVWRHRYSGSGVGCCVGRCLLG